MESIAQDSASIDLSSPPDISSAADALNAFVDFVGSATWRARLSSIQTQGRRGSRTARALVQRHAIELTIERLRRRPNTPPTIADVRVAEIAAIAANTADTLTSPGRDRLRDSLRDALVADATLVPAFHLLRTASVQRERGFAVSFAGFDEAAPFDLQLHRSGVEAEIVCDTVSAEDGRGVHRGAWFRLADRVDPDLQTWLAAHPGRYLLKVTLPQGLQGGLNDEPAADGGADRLAQVHDRIRAMLQDRRRCEMDSAIVLRLDPLLLAAAQADENGLVSKLRREFGPEAHLSVTASGEGLFVMAARAGRDNDVAVAVRRRLRTVSAARLTGTRPGILAMFVEDTDRLEWRNLRDSLQLEGETRQFLTFPEAKPVVAVTCTSRLEMFGMAPPDAVPDGELRFRNPSHPAAREVALAPAVLSSN